METPNAPDAVRRTADELTKVADRARSIAAAAEAFAGMAELAWERRDSETLATMCNASARLALAAKGYFKVELVAIADAARNSQNT